ncbi:MAG: outer membrane beta-barrel protein [Gammaproteobacteria bacterium]|nr:outer membrane beta-barrel protein [Gammaproteobacteria bacterium]
MLYRVALSLLVFINWATVAAADPQPAPTDFKPEGWSVAVYLGRYDVAEEPQFVGVRNKYGLGVGLNTEFSRYPNLGLDLELFFINRDYDTPVGPPLWGVIDNDTSVQTTAFLVGARAFYPASGRFRVYVSGGLGYFQTRMVVSGSVFGFPGVYEDEDSGIEPYYGLGLAYRFEHWGVSLDLRHFDMDGNFSGFNINNANLGGDLLLVGWRYTF